MPKHSLALLFSVTAFCAACSSSSDNAPAENPALDGSVDSADSALDSGNLDSSTDTAIDTALDSSTATDTALDSSTATDSALDSSTDTNLDTTADSPAEAAPQELTEAEPNNGAITTEFNELPLGAFMNGAISKAGDIDIFRIPTSPGKTYEVKLVVSSLSVLQPHLTVIDDGRGGKAAGGDYVKILRGLVPVLDFLAMGSGGYYVAVRDARNVDGGAVGGASFQYRVQAYERPVKDFEGSTFQFPSSFDDKLDQLGGLRLYPFQATEGDNVIIDLKAKGKMDPRLLIFAESEGSWIARNDNRSSSDNNPLIDAPLTAGGKAWVVVENIMETATALGYTVNASK